MHLTESHFFGARDDVTDDRRIVADGISVGHTANLRKAAGNCRRTAAGDIFFVLKTRLAQVNVHIDQTGENIQLRRVDHPGACAFDGCTDLFDLAVFQQQIAVLGFIRKHRRSVFNEEFIHLFRLPFCS